MASTNTFGEVVPAAAQGVGQTCPDAVESQPIAPTEWFWPGWIQRGQLNIIVGDQDAWVSTVAINLIADMSRGSAMPDGQTIETVHTLYWTNERFGSETVKPRLAAAQAAIKHNTAGTIGTA